MPNLCCTTYYFEGDKKCLRDLYNRMIRIANNDNIKDYQKRQNIIELVKAFCLNPSDYNCRGYFDCLHIEDNNSSLVFDVKSANIPCQDTINAIIKHYGGKISVLWNVGCLDEGDYFTNDREKRIFKYRYEVYLEDIDSEWFETIPQAVEWIKQKTGISIPESISKDTNLLYNYITSDLENILNMCCNFHQVALVTETYWDKHEDSH